jgi:regulator of cell morphogenesis and NO signaling
LDELFEQFKALKEHDLNAARPLFLDFRTRLEQHIGWEEDILFPIFEQETGMFDTGPTEVMRREHHQIGDLLQAIDEKILAGNLQGVDEAKIGLLAILGPHNVKEENVIYPALDDLTSEQARKQVLLGMTEVSSGSHP